ncbi:MAG: ATP-binding protein [Burkholderiales bacterium]
MDAANPQTQDKPLPPAATDSTGSRARNSRRLFVPLQEFGRGLWRELVMLPQLLGPRQPGLPATFWRSLSYFNFYRLVVAGSFIFTALVFGYSLFGAMDRRLFWWGSVSYLLTAVFFAFIIRRRRPYFTLQLTLQVFADIVLLVILMHASGGIGSGLGLLLLASLAAAGFISRGRLALFYAALASIAVLLEQTLQVLNNAADAMQYAQAGLLSVGYFATAWVAHTLAGYALASEQLAQQRGIDIANLAQVNQLVLQDMQDGVMVVDDKGVIRQRNSQSEKLLAIHLRDDREVLLQDYAPALAERLRRWKAGSHAVVEPIPVSPSRMLGARFVGVGRNKPVGTVIFLEDLSRIQAEARQLKLAALGRLTANIAHEIRNPLSSISHAAELLQEEPAHSPTQERLLQIIRDNTQRLDRMVQEVLKLNRRDRAIREAINPAHFLHTFINDFCQIEKISPNLLQMEIRTQRQLLFDRSHLNQVMWNLTRNALRHGQRRQNSIRYSVNNGASEDTVRWDVMDDGPGVAPQVRSQLFEPFFTTAASGTGLGLYIAREVCEANGATLDYVDGSGCGHFTILCKAKL